MSFKRLGALLAVTAMIATACGGAASPTPSPSAAPSEAASATPSSAPVSTPSGPPVTIKWFCCLGGGDDPSTLKIFDQLIKDFNASQTHVVLVLDHVAYSGARDAFATRLASGDPPDLVGPLGVGGGAHSRGSGWTSRRSSRRTTWT